MWSCLTHQLSQIILKKGEKNMKYKTLITICAILALTVISFSSCAGGASSSGGAAQGESAEDSKAVFDDLTGQEWFLLEVQSPGKTVYMERKKLDAINMGGVYTINFQARDSTGGQVSGMGAPNRYFGPYTVSNDRKLSLGPLASTLMAAIIEPEGLKEFEFLTYLGNARRWDLRGGKLELYSTNSEGNEAVLVFTFK